MRRDCLRRHVSQRKNAQQSVASAASVDCSASIYLPARLRTRAVWIGCICIYVNEPNHHVIQPASTARSRHSRPRLVRSHPRLWATATWPRAWQTRTWTWTCETTSLAWGAPQQPQESGDARRPSSELSDRRWWRAPTAGMQPSSAAMAFPKALDADTNRSLEGLNTRAGILVSLVVYFLAQSPTRKQP